jgi:hypothetical protein
MLVKIPGFSVIAAFGLWPTAAEPYQQTRIFACFTDRFFDGKEFKRAANLPPPQSGSNVIRDISIHNLETEIT